jgi:protein-S-isoprenylcysteine O-methyltransferase Ste14
VFYRRGDLIDLIALLTIMVWPVIPLFWIPVHGFSWFFKRIGGLTYIMPALSWPPLAYFIYLNRAFLLHYRIDLNPLIRIAGIVILAGGAMLQIWTGNLLSVLGLMGLPEVSRKAEGRLVTGGAFSYVRHPTYLAHTLIFGGAFLLSGVIAVGVVTLLDFLVINAAIIPLEEKELLVRFGEEFVQYKKRVPRYFPCWRKK